MSETENKPTLGRKPLGLKRTLDAGEVKQTFSHGRTNKVVVEVKRRKLMGKPGEAPVAPPPPPPPPPPMAQAPRAVPRPAASDAETRQEMQARLLRFLGQTVTTAARDRARADDLILNEGL